MGRGYWDDEIQIDGISNLYCFVTVSFVSAIPAQQSVTFRDITYEQINSTEL